MILRVRSFALHEYDREKERAVQVDWMNVQFQLLVNQNEIRKKKFLLIGTLYYAGTLCYCDEFCDQHINPDCCPDYESYCKGIIAEPLVKACEKDGYIIQPFEEVKINCNLW